MSHTALTIIISLFALFLFNSSAEAKQNTGDNGLTLKEICKMKDSDLPKKDHSA